jgi:hypothetical protein
MKNRRQWNEKGSWKPNLPAASAAETRRRRKTNLSAKCETKAGKEEPETWRLARPPTERQSCPRSLAPEREIRNVEDEIQQKLIRKIQPKPENFTSSIAGKRVAANARGPGNEEIHRLANLRRNKKIMRATLKNGERESGHAFARGMNRDQGRGKEIGQENKG